MILCVTQVFFTRGTKDIIIHKDPVELVQLITVVEQDFDDLVNEEEADGDTEDDVGIEGDEGVDRLLFG